MISLLRYECEKLWKRPIFRIIFIICIFLNLFFLWYFQQGDASSVPYDAYKTLHSELMKLPNEKREPYIEKQLQRSDAFALIEEMQKTNSSSTNLSKTDKALYQAYYNEYHKQASPLYASSYHQDQELLKKVLEDARYILDYSIFLKQVEQSAKNLDQVSVFHKDQESLISRNIRKTAEDYKDMKSITPAIVITQGFSKLTQAGVTDVISIIFVFLISLLLIFDEKEKGLFTLLRVNAKGRLHTGIAKIVTSLLVSAIFLLILYGTQFALQSYLTSFPDLGLPIQSVPSFRDSIWKFSIGEYLLVFLITKWVALTLISLFIIAITMYTRQLFMACIGCFSILILSYLLYTYIPAISSFHIWKYLNLVGFLNTNIFYQLYDNILFFGCILSLQSIIFTVLAGLSIFFLIFIILSFAYNRKISEQSTTFTLRVPQRFQGRFCCCSLITHEIYKLLIVQKGIFIVLIAFMIFVNFTSREQHYVQGNGMYQEYLKTMEGPVTSEKDSFIQKEKAEFEKMNIKLNEIDKKYQEKKLTLAQKNIAEEPYMLMLEKQRIFDSILTQYEYVKQHPNAWFVDQRGYLKVLDSMEYEFPLLMTFTMLIILLYSNMFASEHQHQMIRFTSACVNGRKRLAKTKIHIALVLAMISFVSLYLMHVIPILNVYDFAYSNAPISSLMAWKGVPVSISIVWFIVLTLIFKLFSVFIITLLVLSISQVTKSIQSALTTALVLLLAPIILNFMGFDFFSILSLEPIFFSGSYFMSSMPLTLMYGGIGSIASIFLYKYLITSYGYPVQRGKWKYSLRMYKSNILKGK